MSRRREPASDPTEHRIGGSERAAFVARLHLVLRHWPSADRLARAMGVSPSALRKWLKGEAEPSRERLVALAEAAGVSVAWLAMGEGPEPKLKAPVSGLQSGSPGREGGIDLTRFLVLPKRPEAAAAGPVSPTPPSSESEFIAFGYDWIRQSFRIEPHELILETAVGESMLPTIGDRDLLLIDTTDRRFREFGIYVLEFQGERLVKRVQRKLDGSLVLISDNEIYEPERIPPERAPEVTVIGRVVWVGGQI